MGLSETNIGHSGTNFVGIRAVSGTRYCEKCACVAHGWTSGWHSGWPRAAMN